MSAFKRNYTAYGHRHLTGAYPRKVSFKLYALRKFGNIQEFLDGGYSGIVIMITVYADRKTNRTAIVLTFRRWKLKVTIVFRHFF